MKTKQKSHKKSMKKQLWLIFVTGAVICTSALTNKAIGCKDIELYVAESSAELSDEHKYIYPLSGLTQYYVRVQWTEQSEGISDDDFDVAIWDSWSGGGFTDRVAHQYGISDDTDHTTQSYDLLVNSSEYSHALDAGRHMIYARVRRQGGWWLPTSNGPDNECQVDILLADIDVDSDRTGDVECTSAEDSAEMSSPAVVIVNNDDDDNSGSSDNDDAVIGVGDVEDIVKLFIHRTGIPKCGCGWLEIGGSAGNKNILRIFSNRTTSAVVMVGPETNYTYKRFTSPVTDEDMICGLEAVTYPHAPGATIPIEWKIYATTQLPPTVPPIVTDTVNVQATPFIFLPSTAEPKRAYVSDCDSQFVSALTGALGSTPATPVTTVTCGEWSSQPYYQDVWVQDEVELGYVRWPTLSGTDNDMPVVWDLPRYYDQYGSDLRNWPENDLLAQDFGHFEKGTKWGDGTMGGNFEVTPPLTGYPFGRVIMGSYVSQDIKDFIDNQNEQVPYVQCDTSWTVVRHIDEVINFVEVGPGFKVLVADTSEAVSILENMNDEDSGTAESGSTSTLVDNDQNWDTDEWKDGFIEITAGPAHGQVRKIASNTSNTITVTPDWDSETGTAESGTNNTLTDDDKEWKDDHWKQGRIDITAGTGSGQWRAITGNDADTISVWPDWDSDSGTAESGTNNTLVDNDKSWSANYWQGGSIEITAGTGSGQVREISSNTPTTIMVSTNWTTNPDSTSQYEVTAYPDSTSQYEVKAYAQRTSEYTVVERDAYRAVCFEGDEDYGVATSGSTTTLSDSTKSWTTDWSGGVIIIADPPDRRQTQWISQSSSDTVTIDGTWEDGHEAGESWRYVIVEIPKMKPSYGTPTEPASYAVRELCTNDWTEYQDSRQADIDAIRTKLNTDLGIGSSDYIKIPTFYDRYSQPDEAETLMANMVNCLVKGSQVIIPMPFGPKDSSGNDVFEEDVKARLNPAPLSISTDFIDDWDTYHTGWGEVHCGTNATRKAPSTNWW